MPDRLSQLLATLGGSSRTWTLPPNHTLQARQLLPDFLLQPPDGVLLPHHLGRQGRCPLGLGLVGGLWSYAVAQYAIREA